MNGSGPLDLEFGRPVLPFGQEVIARLTASVGRRSHRHALLSGTPSGPFIYANDLVQVILDRSDGAGFRELAIYIEARRPGGDAPCTSLGLLPVPYPGRRFTRFARLSVSLPRGIPSRGLSPRKCDPGPTRLTRHSFLSRRQACESGSVFEGLLPADVPIYATTAASAEESSWATFCPGMDPSVPPELTTCLGDLYSVVSRMEIRSRGIGSDSLTGRRPACSYLALPCLAKRELRLEQSVNQSVHCTCRSGMDGGHRRARPLRRVP